MTLAHVLLVSAAIYCCISSLPQIEAKPLPHDVQQLIFEQLPFSHLYRVVKSHPAFIPPALSAFRHAHSQKLVRINGNHFEMASEPEKTEESGGFSNRVIEIGDYNLTLDFFGIFGTCVKNLHIVYVGMNETQVTEIDRLVDEKCADKLTHIGMAFNPTNQSALISYPNVESVTISGANFRTSENINLNELYPKMIRLELGMGLLAPLKLLSYKLLNLQHLGFQIPIKTQAEENAIEQVLRNNSQIKSLAFEEIRTQFLGVLRSLPTLESLDLSLSARFLSDFGTLHRFENVKKITFHEYYYGDMAHIPFEFGDQLEEVKMVSACGKLQDHWVHFFERHQSIQRLKFGFHAPKCNEFAHIADLRPSNVTELELKNVDMRWIEETERFLYNIGEWEKLDQIHLVDVHIYEEVGIVRAKTKEQWTMKQFQNNDSDDLVYITLTKIADAPKMTKPSCMGDLVNIDDIRQFFMDYLGY